MVRLGYPVLRTLLILLVLCSVPLAGNAQAASPKRFTSKHYGYTFTYPASWTAGPGTSPVDEQAKAPDGLTSFAVQVTGGSLTQATSQSLAGRVVRSLLGVAQGASLAITMSTPSVAGGIAAQAEARGTVSATHRIAVARIVGYDGYVFVFFGSGPTPPSVAVDGPAIALHSILNSIGFTPVRTHFSQPNVHFGMYYPKTWHRVSYPALGKLVEDGPGGAVIFADFGGHLAQNAIDLRFLLLQNVILMGTIQGQPSFIPDASTPPLQVDNQIVQLVRVGIKDKQGRALDAIVADASFNGFNYVFGGAAPKGSAAEQDVIDAITSATMRPPALPPDTGAFIPFTSQGHHYTVQRPAAWIAADHPTTVDAAFTARDGDLTMVLETRTGSPATVLADLTNTQTKGATGVKETTASATLGTLSGQERVIKQTVIPGLTQETHLLVAGSGTSVYVLSWSFYTNIPDAQALQKLVRRTAASFSVTS